MIAYTPPDIFLTEVKQMFCTRGEILVETCYSHAGGSRDIMLIPSLQLFQKCLEVLPARTLVNVYRQYDLPLRGNVDEKLIQSALSFFSSDAEYLIVCIHPQNAWRLATEHDEVGGGKYDKIAGWPGSFLNDEGHVELERDLRDVIGTEVAIGSYPDWGEQYSNILWEVIPNADGSVQIGIY